MIEQLLYWVTQENLIEVPLQSSLPFILLPMVCAHYCAPYPKWPCIEYKVNMWYLCCMMSFVLGPLFSQVSWLMLWPHYQIVTDVTVWPIISNSDPSCLNNRKNKKIKQKEKEKEKENRKNLSPLFVNLTSMFYTCWF